MKFFYLQKATDDTVAYRERYQKMAGKHVCGNCKFFEGTMNDYWAQCHSPLFNRSVQVTTSTGRKTLEKTGGSWVRVGFSCPFFKPRGETVEGADRGPF